MIRLSRRTFVSGLASSASLLTVPAQARSNTRIGSDRLWIRRAETGEELNEPFVFQSSIAQTAAHALYSHFWRDIKDGGEMVWIDMGLIVLMSDLQMDLARIYGRERPIILNSGYRTRSRNATLEGAARNSYHIYGQAGDFTVPGLTPRQVADRCAALRFVGGVGRYPNFTHIDTGRQGRRWGSN